ncbi:MAG: hypothetical protein ACNI26_16290 [Terasakiella sp.]|uniref:hypothetical protein n=1 Tax=unclassified Terasakiella TaxID=2614952 RepID=UPI003AFF8E37
MKKNNLKMILSEFMSLTTSRKTLPLKTVYVFLDVLTVPEQSPQTYANRMDLTKSAIAKQLDYLEELDLVNRVSNPVNGREKLVCLTPKAKLLEARINQQLGA